jgi:hypothetical protein
LDFPLRAYPHPPAGTLSRRERERKTKLSFSDRKRGTQNQSI